MSELDTPWSRARKLKSTKQEQRLGAMEGGRQHPGSGRIPNFKRDGTLFHFLIEARTTDAGSYRIDGEEFQSIRKEALKTPPGLLPAMQIDIGKLQLIAMDLQSFQDMQLAIEELQTKLEAYERQEAQD